MAELLLHELTHTAVYFKDQADFNETAATFFGRQGAKEFLAARFGPDSPQLAEYRKTLEEDDERSRLFDELYDGLEKLYASPASEAEKLERREEIFGRYRPRLAVKTLDNAVVLMYRRYHYDLGDFAKEYDRLGQDWRKMLTAMKGLDPRDPRQALKAIP